RRDESCRRGGTCQMRSRPDAWRWLWMQCSVIAHETRRPEGWRGPGCESDSE
ncbi:hypothetical protein B0H12DRAFT_1134078, partial [Mycena haematopus]